MFHLSTRFTLSERLYSAVSSMQLLISSLQDSNRCYQCDSFQNASACACGVTRAMHYCLWHGPIYTAW
eukprot:scaffold381792_cov22-Prasinocladus_malaysianus.AAC.1